MMREGYARNRYSSGTEVPVKTNSHPYRARAHRAVKAIMFAKTSSLMARRSVITWFDWMLKKNCQSLTKTWKNCKLCYFQFCSKVFQPWQTNRSVLQIRILRHPKMMTYLLPVPPLQPMFLMPRTKATLKPSLMAKLEWSKSPKAPAYLVHRNWSTNQMCLQWKPSLMMLHWVSKVVCLVFYILFYFFLLQMLTLRQFRTVIHWRLPIFQPSLPLNLLQPKNKAWLQNCRPC